MANNKKNVILRIQEWIESVSGQTFLNYAYSWGAAVVILGALFKLTHIAGANALLFVGMGTEVLVFLISGFDRPVGLKQEEEEVARLTAEEEEWEEDDLKESPVGQSDSGPSVPQENMHPSTSGGDVQSVQQPAMTGSPIIIGGVGGISPAAGSSSESSSQGNGNAFAAETAAASVQAPSGGQPSASPQTFDVKMLADMVNASNAEILEAAREACAPEMKEAAEAYVGELKTLTETLTRVSEQAERMTRDSKEMDNLNRTLTGINTIYEMQLKSISTQIGTIDQINEQTRKMARQIEDLNGIYTRMIQALTVNMKNTAGGAGVE
ncbi:MAG: gliding motility protein GldL [Paraprevotella sp.]|nr:gliding motility protein GldL [Paraprevotella sp.]